MSVSISKQGNNFRHPKCTNRQRYTWKLRGMKSMPTEAIHRNYYESGSRIRNFNADSTNTGHSIMSHFYPANIRPVRLKKFLLLTTVQNSRLSKQQRANLSTRNARKPGETDSNLHYLTTSLTIKHQYLNTTNKSSQYDMIWASFSYFKHIPLMF